MGFKPGNRANPGGRKKALISPVTLSMCKTHYVELCKLIPSMELLDRVQALLKMLQFEHAELFGKPKEKVEVTGKDGTPLQANIIFGYKPGGSE